MFHAYKSSYVEHVKVLNVKLQANPNTVFCLLDHDFFLVFVLCLDGGLIFFFLIHVVKLIFFPSLPKS